MKGDIKSQSSSRDTLSSGRYVTCVKYPKVSSLHWSLTVNDMGVRFFTITQNSKREQISKPPFFESGDGENLGSRLDDKRAFRSKRRITK